MRCRRLESVLAVIVLLCTGGSAAAQVGTVRFASGLDSPTYLAAPPGDFTRVFVTERFGDIEILDRVSGQVRATPFLSISDAFRAGLEGLVFDAEYATNGFFYVQVLRTDGIIHVSRYTRSTSDPDLADPTSELTILLSDQSHDGHTGGWMGFGPDGYLYVFIGDGGEQHDPENNGQTIVGQLQANILRIDVHGDDFPGDPDRNYAIPADNPFVGATGEDEIWAYGLRNPFRGAFDPVTGDLYIADVGQDTREELNLQPASSTGGENYGWRLREGSIATPTGGIGGPQPPDGVDPFYEYVHGTGPSVGMSITGGFVYSGPIVSLVGKYFFGDYENERIWSIEHDGIQVTEFLDWTDDFVPPVGTINEIVAFGEDALGEMYIVDLGGEVFKVVGPTAVPALHPTALLIAALGFAGAGAWALVRLGSA